MNLYVILTVTAIIGGLGLVTWAQHSKIDALKAERALDRAEIEAWQRIADKRKKRVNELTASLTEREHELARYRKENRKMHVRLENIDDECLDLVVPPELDRLLLDAFPPARDPGDAEQPGPGRARDADVDAGRHVP
jgi:hypothetical protein